MKSKRCKCKTNYSVILFLVLITVFISGCSNSEKANSNSGNPDTLANVEKTEGITGLNTVSILVDLLDGGGPPDAITKTLYKVPGYGKDFTYMIETLPISGQERDSAIARVRTEIMAGKGPDLFLCAQRLYGVNAGSEDMPFFKFPIQAMSNHIFLPLDNYIDEAEHIDWNTLQPVVMKAGRNDEGQQIIPLAYTFEVALFDHSYKPESQFPMTWEQMTEDPDPNIRATSIGLNYNIIGDLADYSKDIPAFTEEELLTWIAKQYETSQTLQDDSRNVLRLMLDRQMLSLQDYNISLGGKQEYTMIPVYNVSGGVTANITTFAAINRNARRPDEAFIIIDYLLDPDVQQASPLFEYRMEGLPVYTGTGNSDTPQESYWQMNETNYKAVTAVQEQINVANFPGPLEACLWDVDWYDEEARKKSVHEQYVLMQMLLAES